MPASALRAHRLGLDRGEIIGRPIDQLVGGGPELVWRHRRVSAAARRVLLPGLCRQGFSNNEVRFQPHALAFNPGKFMPTLALPHEAAHPSPTTLRE